MKPHIFTRWYITSEGMDYITELEDKAITTGLSAVGNLTLATLMQIEKEPGKSIYDFTKTKKSANLHHKLRLELYNKGYLDIGTLDEITEGSEAEAGKTAWVPMAAQALIYLEEEESDRPSSYSGLLTTDPLEGSEKRIWPD